MLSFINARAHEVEEVVLKNARAMGLLEHRWIGYDRYYAVGDFFDEWELQDEEDDIVA